MTSAFEQARRREQAEQVAYWRYQLIRDAADPGLSPRARGRLVRTLAATVHRGPFGEQTQVSRQSLDRWIRMSSAPIKVHIRREKLVEFLADVRPGGALVIEQDNVALTVGTRTLSLGPGYWTANVRLTNRRQLQRLRPDLIDRDPEAVFEVTSDDGLCLTLGQLVRDAELSAA